MKVIGTRGRLTSEELGQQTQDISKRSITPDTHKARIMSHNLKDFDPQQLLHDPEGFLLQISQEITPESSAEEEVKQEDVLPAQITDYSFYVDAYSYNIHPTSRVLHFGINTHKQGLSDDILVYNNETRENISKKVYDPLSKVPLDQISNISNESNYGKLLQYIQPTNIEQFIVNNAIQYLRNTGDRTVLVDLFPRVLKAYTDKKVGTIDLTENIEPHTALLYNAREKILVIDPNNPQFSAFLKNVNSDLIESSYRADDKIYMRAGEAGVYTWRDCIDIAVKLAFILNSSENTYLSIKSIMNSQEIQWITNNSEIDESIFYSNINPVREKQKSDISLVRQFYSKQEELAIRYNEEKTKKDTAHALRIAELTQEHDLTIQNLETECLGELQNSIEQEAV